MSTRNRAKPQRGCGGGRTTRRKLLPSLRRRKLRERERDVEKAGTWRRETEREDFLWDAGYGCRRLDRVPTFGRGRRGHAQSGARQGGELPWGAGQWARRPRGRRVDHCLPEHLHLDEVTPACAKVAELWVLFRCCYTYLLTSLDF